jgi:uncharacterized Zn-finger protein
MHNIALPPISKLPLPNFSILYLPPIIDAAKQHKFECNLCCKQFNSKSSLKRHLNTHSKTKYYECKVCCKSFGRKDILLQHRKTRKCLVKSTLCNGNSNSLDDDLKILFSELNLPISNTSLESESKRGDIRMSISWILADAPKINS